MKKLTLFAFLLFSCLAFAQTQAVRFGDGEPVLSNQTIPGYGPPFITGVSNAQINFCQAPANAVPCTNLATTYTDSTASTACSLSQQVVLDGTTTCVTTTDTRGNWGVWALPGQYAYTVTVSGTSYGPFFATLGGASGGGGGGTVIPGAANDVLASAGNSTSILVDTGKITINPTTHFLNAYGFQSNSGLPFILNGLPSGSACTAGPSGQVQYAFCPGPLATLSYNSDGPFPIQRYGLIGSTATQMPSSTYMPLDSNGTMPFGSLGDVGWARINPGVMGLVNSASLTSPTRLNLYGGAGFGTNGQMVSLNYSTGFSAFQLTTDKNGSGGYTPLQLCTGGSANCGGWQISAGSTPGNLFPISQNTTPDIGSISNGQVRNLFLNGSAVNSGTYVIAYTNDSTGTQIGKLAKRSASQDANLNVEATIATTADTTGLLGVVIGESTGGTCGVGANCTTGVAYVATQGHTTAAFDGSTTLKHWAIASTSAAGDLSDSGTACSSVPPTGVDVLGCIQGTNTGAGTYNVDLALKSASPTGVPTGVAAGSALVSTSVGAAPAYQTKPYIDVRDYGVVCGTSTDSTAGVNAAFAAVPNWGTILFPPACPIKITSTITVSNKLGMKVIFREAPDAANNSSATGLYWFGPAGGDMLYLNQVHGGEWNGLQLYCSGAGTGFPSTAGCNRALVIGELGTVLNISTAITFHGGYIQNQETNASFIGVEIGDTAPANVENMHFDHFPVECGLSIPGSATGAIGFHINGTTAQPDNTIIEGAGPVYCSKGLYIVGNTKLDKIRNFTGGSNYTDLSVGGGSDLTYEGIRSENSTQPIALTTTQNGTITLRKLEFGNPGAPQISITAGVGGQLLLDSINFGGSGIQALSFGTSPGNSMRIVESNSSNYDSLFSSNLLVAGGGVYSSTFGYTPLNIAASIKYPLAFNQTGPSSLIQWSSSYFNNVSAIEQDYFRTGVINAPANAAATWIMDYVKPPDYAEVTSLAFGLPFSGISTIAVNTPVTPTISNSGTAGSTSYTYAVVARGGYGTSAASTTASTATGNATLSGNNCNVVTFVNLNTNSTKNTGIWSYDIYRTASSGTPSSTGKIGSVAALAASGLQYSFSDCGASGDSSTAPSVNTSGGFGSAGPITYNTDNSFDFGASGANRPRTGYFATSVVSTAYQTTTNCSSSASPAVCASAAAGSVVIAAAATTVQVNTTAVTANSQITIDFDESLGTKLSVTCNTASASEGATYFVSARTAGTSFTIKTSVAPTTNPACLSYTIVN